MCVDPRESSCRRIAEEQYGLITAQQAREAGMTRSMIRRRLDNGTWTRLGGGPLRFEGAPDGWRQRVLAACLAHARTVASHRTAGALHGMDGVRAREIELLTDSAALPKLRLATVRRTRYLPDADVRVLHGIPVTSPARTLLDLGSVCDRPVVRRALEDSLGRRLVSLEQVHDLLRRCGRKGRPGTATLRTLLGALDVKGSFRESALEDACLQTILGGGFAAPEAQFPIWIRGSRKRIDFAYPEKVIAIEADGWEFHSARVDFLNDRARQNDLVALGWRVLRFTSEDAKRPRDFLDHLAALLNE